MPKHKFDVIVRRPSKISWDDTPYESFVETIEADDAEEALEIAKKYRVTVVPSS